IGHYRPYARRRARAPARLRTRALRPVMSEPPYPPRSPPGTRRTSSVPLRRRPRSCRGRSRTASSPTAVSPGDWSRGWRGGAFRAVAHNATFAMGFLRQAGVRLVPDCTLLAGHVLTGRAEKLSVLAERHLGLHLDKAEQKSDWSGELFDEQLRYAARDAVAV